MLEQTPVRGKQACVQAGVQSGLPAVRSVPTGSHDCPSSRPVVTKRGTTSATEGETQQLAPIVRAPAVV